MGTVAFMTVHLLLSCSLSLLGGRETNAKLNFARANHSGRFAGFFVDGGPGIRSIHHREPERERARHEWGEYSRCESYSTESGYRVHSDGRDRPGWRLSFPSPAGRQI